MIKIVIIFLFLFSYANPALAYLDPGASSIILQFVIGGIAAIATFISVYWRKFKNYYNKYFKNFLKKNKSDNKN